MTINEQLTLATSISSFIVSLLALGLGYAAYKKFLSQKLAESQLTVVLDFVKAVYQSDISIWEEKRTDSVVSGHRSNANLFQLSSGKKNRDNGQQDDFPVFIVSRQALNFQGWEFMQNPLLPNAISKELYALRKGFQPTDRKQSDFGGSVILGTLEGKGAEAIFGYEFQGGYKGFIERCTLLDKAIKSWLEKHGLSDLNQHVVNTSPFDYYTKQEYYDVDKETYERYQTIMKRAAEVILHAANPLF